MHNTSLQLRPTIASAYNREPDRSIEALRSARLTVLGGIYHGFFGRNGGVSNGIYNSLNCGFGSGDDADNVRINRSRVAKHLATQAGDPSGRDIPLITLKQSHTTAVVEVSSHEAEQAAKDGGRLDTHADAMVCREPNIALGILTADCAPVLLADARTGIIGGAHAGWKGALAGIVGETVAAMQDLGADPDRICAAIGPTISPRSYEVGEEFRAQFIETETTNRQFFTVTKKTDHFMFDLPGYIITQLENLGIKQVSRLPLCTFANNDRFFSNRQRLHRDEPDYGRQISAIVRMS